jgi:hypothetical protein
MVPRQVPGRLAPNLAAFHVIGFPVTQTFGDTAAAPLDPFEDRG